MIRMQRTGVSDCELDLPIAAQLVVVFFHFFFGYDTGFIGGTIGGTSVLLVTNKTVTRVSWCVSCHWLEGRGLLLGYNYVINGERLE